METKLKNVFMCYPQGKHKAITLSYDDGKQEDRRLVALLNAHAMKGTFHINSGLSDPQRIPREEWATLYAGHEVACHTVLHPTIARCPLDQVALQVLEDRRSLERAVGYPVRGLSYPNGSYSKDIMALLPSLGIAYGRVVGSTHDFSLPEDFLEWKATCHHNHNLLENAEKFVALHKQQYLYLMYVWGHSYEFTQDNNWALMEAFCEKVAGKEDTWYATNLEIVNYLAAARSVRFTIDADKAENPSAIDVWVSVDGVITQIPSGQTVQCGSV